MKGRNTQYGLSIFTYILRQVIRSRTAVWVGVITALGSTMIVLNAYLVHSQGSTNLEVTDTTHDVADSQSTKTPILWIYHKTDRPLAHVIAVFNRIGYEQGGPADEWDVLWSHEYPFNSLPPGTWSSLKPHQKINHFPYTGCFTSKPQLATLDFPFIPKAFQLPKQAEELKREAIDNPGGLWIQKSNKHRGIKVKNIKNIDTHSEGFFVQRFIANPLLIDGRKFDIGLYTVITSVNPLRVYVYQDEILLRFCSKDYHPFRVKDTVKYVVNDDYTPASELPSLRPMIVGQKFGRKQALNVALRRRGFDTNAMWENAHEAIRKVLLHCENKVITGIKKYGIDSRHFFELVRFDFVIDEDFNLWLMEVNLSPNLSSDHFPENRFMYEQVLFNTLSLVGLSRPAGEGRIMRYNGQYETVMLVNDYNIQVPLEECVSGVCQNCSSLMVCQLCKPCRSERDSFVLKTSFLEYINRGNFLRVYPPSTLYHATTRTSHNETIDPKPTTSVNSVMKAWFDGKCSFDKTWCL